MGGGKGGEAGGSTTGSELPPSCTGSHPKWGATKEGVAFSIAKFWFYAKLQKNYYWIPLSTLAFPASHDFPSHVTICHKCGTKKTIWRESNPRPSAHQSDDLSCFTYRAKNLPSFFILGLFASMSFEHEETWQTEKTDYLFFSSFIMMFL